MNNEEYFIEYFIVSPGQSPENAFYSSTLKRKSLFLYLNLISQSVFLFNNIINGSTTYFICKAICDKNYQALSFEKVDINLIKKTLLLL